MEFKAKRMIRVFGPQRSGNHAIINWMLAGAGPHRLFNALDLDFFEKLKKPFNTELAVATYETKLIHFSSYEPTKLIECDDVLNVVILRDPFNWFASLTMRLLYQLKDEGVRFHIDDWKSHAREFLGRTNILKRKVTINYNTWFVNPAYRRAVAKSLKVPFTDKNFQKVATEGGGSSFDKTRFNRKAQKMKVFDRWRAFYEHDRFIKYLRDKELLELTEQIFPDIIKKEAKPIYNKLTGG
jgi:hypothetical protein